MNGFRDIGQHPCGSFPNSSWLSAEGLQTAVFSQLDFGSESAKPTRFLLHLNEDLPATMVPGCPDLDENGVPGAAAP